MPGPSCIFPPGDASTAAIGRIHFGNIEIIR